jgi:hypothetical protein
MEPQLLLLQGWLQGVQQGLAAGLRRQQQRLRALLLLRGLESLLAWAWLDAA